MFSLCKDFRFKTTTNSMASFNPPALLLLLHKWFWLKLRPPGLSDGRAEAHGKWIDNDLGEQRHPSDQERTHWFDGRDLNQETFFEVPAFLRFSWRRGAEAHCSAQQWLLRISCSKVGKKGFCEYLKSVRCKTAFSGEVVWRKLGVSQCIYSASLLNKTVWGPVWRLTGFSFKG